MGAAMDFKLPELGEGVYEAEVVACLVKPGDTVKPGQTLLEVLTDKATMEVPAPFSGRIKEIHVAPGQQIKVGEIVLSYDETGKDSPVTAALPLDGAAKAPAREPVHAETRPPRGPEVPVKAAPSVRLLARQMGIDLSSIRGSGPEGRILIEDLKVRPAPAEPAPATHTSEDFGTPGTRIKLVGLRRKIAEHMVQAKTLIPHYSYVDECDVSELVRLKESLRAESERRGIHLTYLPFFIQAVAATLKQVPIVNATMDEEKGEIILHDRYHIGIAVATPEGLLVPVVHDADKKDLLSLAREIDRLSRDARTRKLRREDLIGSTFTVTSFGNIGGLFATPIIHHPEVGILGIGKIVKRPIFDAAGRVRSADMIYLSFSFDHRVLDGAVGAAFGNALIKNLQTPAARLLT
jgi:pyruvate/2-oxoglutarate dehydrogenase complex dihydrolipoamide acyltransferase (E2) component